MSFVAVAVVGGAVVSGVMSNKAASKASKASSQASQQAADATVQSTQLQIDEIRRQFDYQQQVLAPLVANQQRASNAYANLLGYGGAPVSSPPSSAPSSGPPNMSIQPVGPGGRDYSYRPTIAAPPTAPTGGVTIDGRTGAVIGPNGQPFRDPNVNYLALGSPSGAQSELGQAVRTNALAAPTAAQDELVSYVGRTGLSQGGPAADSAVQRAANVTLGSAITGTEGRDRAAAATNAGAYGTDLAVTNAQNNRLSSLITGTEAQDRAASVTNAGDYATDLAVTNAQNNRLSSLITGTEAQDRATNVRLAAPGGYTMDPRFQFAQGTETVGDTFTSSPGYNFQLEQAQKALDYKNSAGGNYGGRALLEAQRQAQGLAQQDYYNWLGARQADLSRQDAAIAAYQGQQATDVARGDQAVEADLARKLATGQFDVSRLDAATADYLQRRGVDISRGDTAVENDLARKLATGQFDVSRLDAATADYLQRRGVDISRGDQAVADDVSRILATRQTDIQRGDAALADYRNRQQLDLSRSDAAYENYLARRATDVQRGDTAILNNQQLNQYDLQRQDQSYYNYLASLGGAAGLNVGAPQAVAASSNAAAGISGAYAQQGNALSSIYMQRGQDQANIALGNAANINNSFQSGLANWLTYSALKPAAAPKPAGYGTNYLSDYTPGAFAGYS